jgi:hypothetical protein
MALTKADLRDAVAEEIGIKRAEETLAAADADKIERVIDGLREYLLAENLCYWDGDDIPLAVQEPLVMLVGSRCGPSFGVPYDHFSDGLILLQQHCMRRSSGQPVKAEYF